MPTDSMHSPPEGGNTDDPRDMWPATRGDVRRILAELAELREQLGNQPTEHDDERHYTPDEVAKLRRCSRRHVYELIRRGRIRVLRLGDPERGRMLIPASELERLQREVGR